MSRLIVGLAPMEGITDFATRLWFAKTSQPEFCSTPFYRATASSTGKLPPNYAPELVDLKNYIPYKLIPQVMTGEADQFCVMAEEILKYSAIVDLNCGCPSPTVVGRGSGSSVLENTDKFSSLVDKISTRIGAPNLSVKMRLGFNHPSEILPLVTSLRNFRLQRLTIHGRTRPQRYTGEADWNLIHEASMACVFPVMGSGDIYSSAILQKKILLAPRINAYIIGRGAIRNPWIFEEIRSGEPIIISKLALFYALTSFAKLQEMQKNNFEDLVGLIKTGLFLQPCGVNEELWRIFYSNISGGSDSFEDLQLTAFAFARIKMLWNHFRTSLPHFFWSPLPLKCKSFREFIECLQSLCREVNLFTIAHNPDWNWLFSGEKRSQ